jgi:hypothetical protein
MAGHVKDGVFTEQQDGRCYLAHDHGHDQPSESQARLLASTAQALGQRGQLSHSGNPVYGCSVSQLGYPTDFDPGLFASTGEWSSSRLNLSPAMLEGANHRDTASSTSPPQTSVNIPGGQQLRESAFYGSGTWRPLSAPDRDDFQRAVDFSSADTQTWTDVSTVLAAFQPISSTNASFMTILR